jgi:hypothetical protein
MTVSDLRASHVDCNSMSFPLVNTSTHGLIYPFNNCMEKDGGRQRDNSLVDQSQAERLDNVRGVCQRRVPMRFQQSGETPSHVKSPAAAAHENIATGGVPLGVVTDNTSASTAPLG